MTVNHTTPAPGTLAYADLMAQQQAALNDQWHARQQRLIALEASRECWQCHGTTEGSRIAWICDTCRMARS